MLELSVSKNEMKQRLQQIMAERTEIVGEIAYFC